MLKIQGIRDEGPEVRLYEISGDGRPALEPEVLRVAGFASQLLRENELEGTFRSAGGGVLGLELSAAKRTFFHDGIVFAALDAVNDPVKNPTLTRFEVDLPPEDGGPV